MIQGLLGKQVIKILMPILLEILEPIKKYCFEDNELDVKVKDLEKNITDIGFKHTASIDMIKKYSETIDNIEQKVKSIDKVINKFDEKIKQIDKIAHPPAIPLKDINEFKDSVKDVRWMMNIFNNMKKISLLKSIFK